MEDKEIQAIASVNDALKDLAEDERYRVIQWLANKYVQNMPPLKVATPTAATSQQELIGTGENTDEAVVEDTAYETFAELLDASGAEKEAEMFLVAAYWLQVISGADKWKSFEVNKLLKDTGNQIDTISNSIRTLEARKPKPIIQLKQTSGPKRAGSKEFKLTSEGIKAVEKMLKDDK